MTNKLGLLLLAAFLATACSTAGAPTPSPSPTPTPTPLPTPTPQPTDNSSAFYLRAWLTQALPPDVTFNWLSTLTISDGLLIDGNVAVPAIYPGPLMISPIARTISDEAIAAIIDEAEVLGLLGDETDFTGGNQMPGSQTAQIQMIVDGVDRTIFGDPTIMLPCAPGQCQPDPGTPEAFAAFWQDLVNAQTLLDSELGPSGSYEPERVALRLTAPPPEEPGLSPESVEWPLDTPLADTGVEFPGGAEGERCITLEGEDLALMLPILENGNQLSTVVDTEGTTAGMISRVLVPGEESPCPDQSA